VMKSEGLTNSLNTNNTNGVNMTQKIWIAKHSLRYENNLVSLFHVTRQKYSDMLQQRKTEKYTDYFLERVTAKKAVSIRKEQRNNDLDKKYNERIMQKYGVNSNWKSNRYFVEQVRPTAF